VVLVLDQRVWRELAGIVACRSRIGSYCVGLQPGCVVARLTEPANDPGAHHGPAKGNVAVAAINSQKGCAIGGLIDLRKGDGMRIFVALLVVLAVLYYWDANYNNGILSDGVIRMEKSMFHHMGH
jgi:hypothetical protein